MDILLHLGAHRCATTSFQAYLAQNAAPLAHGGLGVIGPDQTRNGLFDGLMGPVETPQKKVRRGQGRLALNCAMRRQSGLRALLISEENMIGAMRANLRAQQLYPLAVDRLARFGPVVGRSVTRIGLAIRSYDSYWASALSFAVAGGHRMPDDDLLDRLVTQPRRWRDLICDVTSVFPRAAITVWRFDEFAARPDQQLALMTGAVRVPALRQHPLAPSNASPNRSLLRKILIARGLDPSPIRGGLGRWMPFNTFQQDTLRAQYADDLAWLAAGADGLAHFATHRAATAPPPASQEVTGALEDAISASAPQSRRTSWHRKTHGLRSQPRNCATGLSTT